MAKIKTAKDLTTVVLDTLNGVLAGDIKPEVADSVAKLGNLALKIEVAQMIYTHKSGTNGLESEFFHKNGIEQGSPKRVGPKFDWNDEGGKSFGAYVGTKVTMMAWKVNGGSFAWSAQYESVKPISIGSGDNKPTMESAKRMAEAAAIDFMENNAHIYESGE